MDVRANVKKDNLPKLVGAQDEPNSETYPVAWGFRHRGKDGSFEVAHEPATGMPRPLLVGETPFGHDPLDHLGGLSALALHEFRGAGARAEQLGDRSGCGPDRLWRIAGRRPGRHRTIRCCGAHSRQQGSKDLEPVGVSRTGYTRRIGR